MTRTEPPGPAVIDRTTGHEQDTAAIHAIVADIEAGLNNNDPDLMTAHFAENAVAVGVNGVYLSGWAALHDAHIRGVASFLRDKHVRYDVIDVVFIRPDVALAHKHARATDAAGELVDVEPTMTALYVLTKERQRWWIVARQNTLVSP